MGIFGYKHKAFSTKEWVNELVVLIDVRGDPSVSVCKLGLSRTGVVVVEIWVEVFPVGGIWLRSQWGEWYGVPESCGMVL